MPWMRRSRRLLLLLALATASGCGAPSEAPRGRALLIGVDGASPKLVARLIDEGQLPNLAALAKRGASGSARSLRPILSPRIWTTMATGKLPEVHGIEHFAHQGAGGPPKLYTSLDRKVPAVWNIAAHAGRRVGVVNWLMTQPPEDVNGVMISDHGAPGALAGRMNLAAGVVGAAPGRIANSGKDFAYAHPPTWVPRFSALQVAEAPLVEVPSPFAGRSGPLWERLQLSYERDGMVTRAALAIEAEEQPDLLMVYLNGVDAVSHLFWASLEPVGDAPPEYRTTETIRERQRTALLGYYRYTDALVGALAARYGAEDLVMVVSDHGFELARPGDKTAGVHFSDEAIDGIVYAAGGPIAPGSEVADMGVADVAPTLLAWLGLPVADDMTGSVASFLDVAPQRVASHDAVPIARVEAGASEADAEILDQLRALGYIDE